MVKMIHIYPNFYVIENVNISEKKQLLYKFATWNKVFFRHEGHVFKEIDNNIHLPASIPIGIIREIFPYRQEEYHLKEYAKPRCIEFNMKYGPRNRMQEEVESFLIDYKNKDIGQKYIGLSPGSGKTFLTINAISQLGVAAMVVVHTSSLAEQWKREFLKHSDITEDDIYMISGAASIYAAIDSPKKAKVYITIHRTLGNIINELPEVITDLNQSCGIGFRIFDEGHLEFTNICMVNNVSNVKYTLYLSATPDRSSLDEKKIYGRVFRWVPFYSGKHIEQEKYHTIAIWNFNSLPSASELRKAESSQFGFNRNIWAKNVTTESENILKETIDDIFSKFKLQERQKRTVVILPTIDMIRMAADEIKRIAPYFKVDIFIGETSKEERAEIIKTSDIIVTNDKMFSTGMDLANLEILINFTPIASLVNLEQTVGRLRNLKDPEKIALFIDVTDVGYPSCIKHLQTKRLKFYRALAKKLVIINNEKE